MEYLIVSPEFNIYGKVICKQCKRVCDRHDESIDNGWKHVRFTGAGHMSGICWKCDRENRANGLIE